MYSWNTTIDDTSSIILFSPYCESSSFVHPQLLNKLCTLAEGPVENGWAGWFQDSATQFNSFGGEQAIGESLHYTSFPGANLYLQFEGACPAPTL